MNARRHRARFLVLALIFALATLLPGLTPAAAQTSATDLSKIDPVLQAAMAADSSKSLPIIVEMNHAQAPFASQPNLQLSQQALTLIQQNGQGVGALALIDAAAGWANASGISAISSVPDVAYIFADSVVQPRRSKEPTKITPPGQLGAPYPRVVNADHTWLQGTTGQGVTVAVLDSGINSDPDLTQPNNRILARVSFAGNTGAVTDPGGHGTHVAGIIAGNGTRSEGEFVGIAPQANLVDVRVLDSLGNGRVSSVVRGIEWVLAHRVQYNIRVINLSLGAPASASYRLDPLSAAVEIAWKRGVVVVAAAGNQGPDSGYVDRPGIDPYAVTVGATDDQGTLTVSDDVLAWFSSWGTPTDSTPKPDVVAPGRRIVSIRSPNSYLDTLFPDRVVVAKNGATYFRLTGTSMATPIVSGAVALVLQHQPGLSPDQVKALLMGTTQPYGQEVSTTPPDPSADGYGLIDAYAATYDAPLPPANQGLRPADGLALALYPILYGQPLIWKDPNYGGIAWNTLTWQNLAWDSTAWNNLAWDSFAWNNLAWDNLAWDQTSWDNLAWDQTGWDNLAWDSLTLD